MIPLVGLLGLALVPGVAASSAEPQITQAPDDNQHGLRQADDILGYTSNGNSWVAVTCGGNAYATLGDWAACADNRGVATGCSGVGTVLYTSTTVVCTSPYATCDTATVMETPGATKHLGIIRCFQEPSTAPRLTYFRTAGSSSSKTSSSKMSSSSRISSSSSQTSSATSTASSDDDDASSSSKETATASESRSSASSTGAAGGTADGGGGGSDRSEGGQNLAWIAGPVVGGLAAIAIIILLVWIVRLLRKRNAEQEQAQAQPSTPPAMQQQQQQPFMAQQQQHPSMGPASHHPYAGAYVPYKAASPAQTHTDASYAGQPAPSELSAYTQSAHPVELQDTSSYSSPPQPQQPWPQQQTYDNQQNYQQQTYQQQQQQPGYSPQSFPNQPYAAPGHSPPLNHPR